MPQFALDYLIKIIIDFGLFNRDIIHKLFKPFIIGFWYEVK